MATPDNVTMMDQSEESEIVENLDDLDSLLSESIIEEVDLSEIYGRPKKMHVRAIPASEYESWQLQAVKVAKNSNAFRELKGKLVLRTLCRADGRPMLDINDQRDQNRVKVMPMPVLDLIFNRAQDLNAFDKTKVEEAEKNSENGLM